MCVMGGGGRHQRGVSWKECGLFPCILATLLAPDQRAWEGMGDEAPAGWRGETRKDAFRPLVLPLRTPDHSRWAPNEAKRNQEDKEAVVHIHHGILLSH